MQNQLEIKFKKKAMYIDGVLFSIFYHEIFFTFF